VNLILSRDQYEDMVGDVVENLPAEACGLLGGVEGRVVRVHPVENALHSPFAYSMEPQRQVEAMLSLEREGLELLAIYHSHPSGPPTPSASDVSQAYYPDSLYVIVAPGKAGEFQARAFQITEERVSEVELSVEGLRLVGCD